MLGRDALASSLLLPFLSVLAFLSVSPEGNLLFVFAAPLSCQRDQKQIPWGNDSKKSNCK